MGRPAGKGAGCTFLRSTNAYQKANTVSARGGPVSRPAVKTPAKPAPMEEMVPKPPRLVPYSDLVDH